MGNLSELMGGQSFRHDAVDTSDVIPEGRYRAIISGCGIKTSKAGARYISIEFTMLNPEVNSRKHWENINLFHDKADVRSVAQKSLAKVCRAVGLGELQDTSQLLKKRCMVTLAVGEDGNGDKRNRLKKIEAWGAASEPSKSPSMPAAPASNDDGGEAFF